MPSSSSGASEAKNKQNLPEFPPHRAHSIAHSLTITQLSVIILFLFRPLNCLVYFAPLSFRIIPNCLLVVRRRNRPRGPSEGPRPFETASSSFFSSSVSVTSLKTLKEFTTTHARPPAKDQRVQLSHGEGGGSESVLLRFLAFPFPPDREREAEISQEEQSQSHLLPLLRLASD